MFVKEIDRALLEGEIDMAVHSLKDMPTYLPEGLTIGAVCQRIDSRDVLVNRWDCTLDDLPKGARIGTSSPRRVAQLRSLRPDLEVLPWRADKLVAFAAPGHPLANSSALSDEQLLSLPWVVREQGSGTRQTFDRAMHGLLSDLDISLELQHTEAIKRAVEAGLGVGCLSIICMQEAFARGSLVPLNIPQRDFSRRFSIILHRQKYRGSGLQQWLALCQDW